MLRVVYKYKLELISGVQSVVLPKGAQILHVGVQGSNPTLWALVDPREPMTTVLLHVAATGAYFNCGSLRHVGTLMLKDATVWHVFAEWEATHHGS